MGMNYSLVAKNEGIDDMVRDSKIESYLDRGINAFINAGDVSFQLNGPNASASIKAFINGEDTHIISSEYNQIQRLFEIDLSPFQVFNCHGYSPSLEHIEGEMDWRLYEAKTEEEKNKIKAHYKPKLEEAKIKDIEYYKKNWIETKVVKQMLLDLIQKMKTHPELLDKIEYGYFRRENFKTENLKHPNYFYYIINDFNLILTFIEYVESKGETHMAFYCM
jgi:hypothetical protein